MSNTNPFIHNFTLLGQFLSQFAEEGDTSENDISPLLEQLNGKHYDDFSKLVGSEHILNPWFTTDYIRKALEGIGSMLEEKVLKQWLSAYDLTALMASQRRTVGLVMAGNIPLVGFHDLMCVLAAGHNALVKPSSKDDRLIKKVAVILSSIDPEMEMRIRFSDDRLSGMDAVIATGSNNSARYFEHYFRNIPYIIRKNRNGIAVLTGEESEEELMGLGGDIFMYFGMGCRNVTKLYIPQSYDLKVLLGVLDRFSDLYQHHKYGNNIDYYRTLYLMNQDKILDNGVLLLKEDRAIASPVGVVFYERYSEIGLVREQVGNHKEEIQCIVSTHPDIVDAIAPGTTQKPMPWDYADGVDTISFLKELK